MRGPKLLARGSTKLAYGTTKRLRVKLTRAGERVLRGSAPRSLKLVVVAPGTGAVESSIRLR